MEKFRFKFERLLDYKIVIEGLKKAEYGRKKNKLNKEQNRLSQYYNFKDNFRKEKEQAVSKINVGNLKMYGTFLKNIDNVIENQQQLVDKIEKEAEMTKTELIEATKQKKIFEKVKQNEYSKYLYLLKKDEEKLNDNIISFKMSAQQ